MSVQFWIVTGAAYIALVIATGYWRYLVPTSWSICPEAIQAVGSYLSFHYPPLLPGQPFNAAQKLSYFVVVFLLGPLQIATGAPMSPAVLARFPWYRRLFGSKQAARSIHFLGLCAFAAFVVVHTVMVIVHGVPNEFAAIVLGSHDASHRLALAIGLAGIFLILVFHMVVTWLSLRYRRRTQRMLGWMVDRFERVLSRAFTPRQQRQPPEVSPYHRVNGYPPTSANYEALVDGGFRDYRLPIGGLVAAPQLSLRSCSSWACSARSRMNNCIQGWTATAEWRGVPVSSVLDLVQPLPGADTLVLFDDKGETEGEGRWGFFYGTLPLWLARNPQTLLVLEMNGGPLPVQHGVPVRLRLENQLGFKMTKWIRGIELTHGYSHIGMGQGGWREDQQYYAKAGGI